jgi:hypothetical protein
LQSPIPESLTAISLADVVSSNGADVSWWSDEFTDGKSNRTTKKRTNKTRLGGAGILLRRSKGHDIDQVANDVGMSRQMVVRYMRFRDQVDVTTEGVRRLRARKGQQLL